MKVWIFALWLTICVAASGFAQHENEVLMAPGDWRPEQLELPLSFAPEIPISGFEEVAFAPNWSKPDKADFWTYTFVWVLDKPLKPSQEQLEKYLRAYYDGLMKVVGGYKEVATQVKLKKTKEGYQGAIETLDAFFTKERIQLKLTISITSEGRSWFFKVSPKEYEHANWALLNTITVKPNSPSFSSFTSFDGIKIAYTDQGSGDAVLLLHGFIGNGSSWNKSALKKLLLEAGYRVIVPDLRGNGKSDQPEHSEAYQNDAEVKDLLALADHLNLSKYSAVGYSRGSIVLAKLLTQEPQIKKAVIGGMGADFTNPEWNRRKAFADAFGGRTALTPMTEGAVNYAKSIGANLKILGYLQDYQPVTSPAALQQLNVPTLVVCGDVDTDNGNPTELQKLIPHSRLVLVKGDHNNTYKQANFADAVMTFLGQ